MRQEINLDYIRGFTDADGTVLRGGYGVYIYNSKIVILRKMSQVLKDNDIENRIRKVKRKNPKKTLRDAFVLEVNGPENVVKFYDKIGLCIESKSQLLAKRAEMGRKRLEELKPKNYDLLHDLYWNKKMSTYVIGEKLGISSHTVQRWMIDLGIPRRTMLEANNNAVLTKRWRGRWSKKNES